MTPCRRSGVQSLGRRFSLTDRGLPPELVCANHGVEDGDEFPHRSGERACNGWGPKEIGLEQLYYLFQNTIRPHST